MPEPAEESTTTPGDESSPGQKRKRLPRALLACESCRTRKLRVCEAIFSSVTRIFCLWRLTFFLYDSVIKIHHAPIARVCLRSLFSCTQNTNLCQNETFSAIIGRWKYLFRVVFRNDTEMDNIILDRTRASMEATVAIDNTDHLLHFPFQQTQG